MLGRSAASSFSCTSLHELMLLNSLSTRRGSLHNDIYWLNIKADVPFGAVIEHTNFVPWDYYREHIVYIASYFQDENDPLWRMSEEAVVDLYVRGLQNLFPTFDKSSINWWKLTRDIYAAPVFEKGFKSKILPYKTSINGLYVAGMFSLPNYPERTMEVVCRIFCKLGGPVIPHLNPYP